MAEQEWQLAGHTGVDSGMVLITDPGYTVRNPEQVRYHPFESWTQFTLAFRDLVFQCVNQFGAKVGVAVTVRGGDGVYPIYVQRDDTGQVVAAMIRFDWKNPNARGR